MNFLSHMRISHKISTLMVGLVLGFIAIGVVYYIQINVDSRIRATERNSFEFQNQITQLNLKQLQMQAAAEQFLAAGRQSSLERLEALHAEVKNDIEGMAAQGRAFGSVEQISQLAGLLQEYDAAFQAAVAARQAYQATSDSNWNQTLAEGAQTLESVLVELGSPQLLEGFADLHGLAEVSVEAGVTSDFALAVNRFRDQVASSSLAPEEQDRVIAAIGAYSGNVESLAQGLIDVNAVGEKLQALETSISQSFASALDATAAAAERIRAESAQGQKVIQAVVTAIIFMVAMGTAVGIYLIYKSIVFPMVHIQSVIRQINKGKTHSRVKLQTQDELGDLGKAFNKLFDERIQQLEAQSLENERLNNSIISLIRSLGMIAKKDLTIKVPVSADITGTVSDAVNLLTTETAKTLHQVKDISEEVDGVSNQLQAQSTRVMQFADSEKKQILATGRALDILARAMNEVAKRAEDTNQTASEAIENTRSARKSVEDTVDGIRTIRETIAETEKRTKRLGDRSQEISGIVSLINTIAERTHILALNASMHAASAGEAGKGFAVVADEVQRLAESARQSTDDIAAMVNNMRVETADTVNIMNTLISQVADGSRMAEEAGQRMTTTETATKTLVENVQYIAEQAVQQAEVATRVRDRSAVIRSFSEKTGQQLEQQKQQTDRLKACAETLVRRVNMFTLPENLAEIRPATLDSAGTETVALPSLEQVHVAV